MAMHAGELPLVFNFDIMLDAPGVHKLACVVIGYWTNFAAAGSPGLSIVNVQWPKYDPDGGRETIHFDATSCCPNVTVQHNFRKAACDFWDRLAVKTSAIAAPTSASFSAATL